MGATVVPALESSQRSGIRVIARAAAILGILKHYPNGLTLGEIAERVALPRSTVQRIVDALADEGFVIAASPKGGVRLGPTLMALGASSQMDVVKFSRPILEQIAKETGETVDLAILKGDKAVFVDQIAGTYRLGISGTGVAFPLNTSANGKALLAALPAATFNRLRSKMKLARMTRRSVQSWPKLEREIARVRKRGVAVDREETSEGVCAVGVAFEAPSGELAAISIPVPSQRFNAKQKKLAAVLTRYRATLQMPRRS